MPTGKLPQGDPRWREFTAGFDPWELTVDEFAQAVQSGIAFCPWVRDSYRKADNFECGQHVAVDMDTGDERSSIPVLSANILVRMYGGFIYTTPSHTPAAPKARVVFLLNQPIDDPDAYRRMCEFVTAQFDGADSVTTDPARFFYGSAGCDLYYIGHEMHLAEMRELYRRWARTQPRQAAPDAKILRMADIRASREKPQQAQDGDTAWAERIMLEELDMLARTAQGGRNHQLNRAAFVFGQFVADGAISRSEAEGKLEAVAMSIGLGEAEITQTMRSGINSGMKQPKSRTG